MANIVIMSGPALAARNLALAKSLQQPGFQSPNPNYTGSPVRWRDGENELFGVAGASAGGNTLVKLAFRDESGVLLVSDAEVTIPSDRLVGMNAVAKECRVRHWETSIDLSTGVTFKKVNRRTNKTLSGGATGGDAGLVDCPACKTSGGCAVCGPGKNKGDGKCPACKGFGCFAGDKEKICPSCMGAGSCPSCGNGTNRGDGKCVVCKGEGKLDRELGDDSDDASTDYRDVKFEGYASTFKDTTPADRDGDYVMPGAFNETIAEFKKNPVMLCDHRNSVFNIAGSYSKMGLNAQGLYVQGRVSNADDMKSVRCKIAEGHLKALSIGGMFRYDDDGRGIKEVKLFEVSLVAVPANQDALFAMTRKVTIDDVKAAQKFLAFRSFK